MLELKNIKKDYKLINYEVKAIKGINLAFRDSEFVSILGPSGCGKTTLLNIIGGLDKYTSGDVKINNISTKNYKDTDWDNYRNKKIGFVFQSYNLIAHLSVLANVEMGLMIGGIKKHKRRKLALSALTQVGLKKEAGKKPNQLSGGQMQRVAIARAIVNSPEIILADEPTGALDSETSVQVLNILKKISKDRLVIMVTHNSNLANIFSDRIIEMLDGKITKDTQPVEEKELILANNKTQEKKPIKNDNIQISTKRLKADKKTKKPKSKMKFHTAFSLSFKNLMTKKLRTFLIAFAGSIGIIGIALILAVSTGFQIYIDKMQRDTLSNYPLTISQNTVDYSSLIGVKNTFDEMLEYPDDETIYVNKIYETLLNIKVTNKITEDYIENVVKKIEPALTNEIQYVYKTNMNIFSGKNSHSQINLNPVSMGEMGGNLSAWQEIVSSSEFLQSQYDVIFGKLPENKDEIILVVDKYNSVSDIMLASLGLYDIFNSESNQPLTFSDIVYNSDKVDNFELSLLLNNQIYEEKNEDGKIFYDHNSRITKNFYTKNYQLENSLYEEGLKLKIVGVLRLNKDTSFGSLSGVIGYTKQLTEHVLTENLQSNVVNFQKENPTIQYDTGEEIVASENKSVAVKYQENLEKLGAVETPSAIYIYPINFDAKETIKKHLDEYNNSCEDVTDKVFYTDYVGLLLSTVNTVIKAITYVLIAFTSISLVVSSIMIGIITYISVLERTKEIGVLRSLGARKIDVSNVFMSESITIGFTAGLFAIILTYILSIPINLILKNLVDINNIASLNPVHAIILIAISTLLTFVAGVIPARIASKKDPVIALRTE